MAVSKQSSGKWLCQCFPSGRDNRRIRKLFATKGEALAYERFIMSEVNDKPWLGEIEDRRRLSDIVELWYNLHGQSLTAGERTRKKMDLVVEALGDPIASKFTAKNFAHYRNKRLKGEIFFSEKWSKGAAPVTVNLEQNYLSGAFNELIRLGEWKLPNPLENVRKFTIAEKEMAWLTHKQITELLDRAKFSAKKDLSLLIRICLATGARWREAENLTRSHFSPYKITYTRTKGKKNRSVPISKTLYKEVDDLKRDKLFDDLYFSFMALIEQTSITLPRGQLTHVLRHTFAAHFMMNGGNILVLQRILGHSDIKMTMKYAHFAPEHLDTALHFNPLATMTSGSKMAAEVGKHHI